MLPLLPSGGQTQVHLLVPSRKFDLSYDLNFATICTDFQENIEFQFSLGWKALVHRFLGSANAQRALSLMEPQVRGHRLYPLTSNPFINDASAVAQSTRAALAATPSCGPAPTGAPPNNEAALMTQEDLMMVVAANLASVTSRTSMGAVIVVGVVRRLGNRPRLVVTLRR